MNVELWAPDDACRRLIDRGVRTARGVVDSVPRSPETWSQDRGTGVSASRKALTEVAMFASNLLASPEYAGTGLEILESIAGLEHEVEAVLALARRSPEQTVTHGLLLLILTHHGVLEPRLTAEVTELAAQTRPFFPERVPFRLLEDLWVRARYLGEDTRAHRLATLPMCSIASDVADLSVSDRTQSYGLTHAAMYVCDIGLSRPDLPAGELPRWSQRMEAGLAVSCAGQDLDLLAEWVLADIGLSSHAGRFALAGLRTLDGTADLIDTLPSPTFSAAELEALEGLPRAVYRVLHSYHTEVVAAMAALCALRWGWDASGTATRVDNWTAPEPLDLLADEVRANTLWGLYLPLVDSPTLTFVHGELLHAWRTSQNEAIQLLLAFAAHFQLDSELIADVRRRLTRHAPPEDSQLVAQLLDDRVHHGDEVVT